MSILVKFSISSVSKFSISISGQNCQRMGRPESAETRITESQVTAGTRKAARPPARPREAFGVEREEGSASRGLVG